ARPGQIPPFRTYSLQRSTDAHSEFRRAQRRAKTHASASGLQHPLLHQNGPAAAKTSSAELSRGRPQSLVDLDAGCSWHSRAGLGSVSSRFRGFSAQLVPSIVSALRVNPFLPATDDQKRSGSMDSDLPKTDIDLTWTPENGVKNRGSEPRSNWH